MMMSATLHVHQSDRAETPGRPLVTIGAHLFDKADPKRERSWASFDIRTRGAEAAAVNVITDDPEVLKVIARGAMALAVRLEAQQRAEAEAVPIPTQAEAEAQLAPF